METKMETTGVQGIYRSSIKGYKYMAQPKAYTP